MISFLEVLALLLVPLLLVIALVLVLFIFIFIVFVLRTIRNEVIFFTTLVASSLCGSFLWPLGDDLTCLWHCSTHLFNGVWFVYLEI